APASLPTCSPAATVHATPASCTRARPDTEAIARARANRAGASRGCAAAVAPRMIGRMPLQNRVTPFGDIVAIAQRGVFMGNRGIIHDPATRTLLTRRWATKAWITCVCEFRGVRRKVMSRRSWTELFFLDEATAFAAGHRPCFYCRRADAEAFHAAWVAGN